VSSIFSVHSLARDFVYQGKQYEEVKITWFVVERQAPLAPYADAIQDYGQLDEKDRAFPEGYINEQFSRPEAEALKKYLERRPDAATQVEEIELPVLPNAGGCRAETATISICCTGRNRIPCLSRWKATSACALPSSRSAAMTGPR